MRIYTVIFLLFAVSALAASKTLDIYVIDVEGGNATLFVSPSGESLLIDTGNAGAAAPRDAGRIMDCDQRRRASADRSSDHDALAWRSFWRPGRTGFQGSDPRVHRSRSERPARRRLRTTFSRRPIRSFIAKAKHTVAKAGRQDCDGGYRCARGDVGGETIKTPLPGAGKPNPYCANFKPETTTRRIRSRSASTSRLENFARFIWAT